MATISYGATRLQELGGKKGRLKPDANGYYKMIVGAINAKNVHGEHYDMEGSIDQFEPSSSFQKRIREGQCYGEDGHPVKSSRQSLQDFVKRVLRVDTTRTCVHWGKIELDDQLHKRSDNELQPGAIAMVADLKPAGPYASSLQASMENDKENVAFSVRTMTNTYVRGGLTRKKITNMITLDRVVGPGMPGASKWNAPGLEDDIAFTPKIIESLEEALDMKEVSTESDVRILTEVIALAKSGEDGTDFWKNEIVPSYYDWS